MVQLPVATAAVVLINERRGAQFAQLLLTFQAGGRAARLWRRFGWGGVILLASFITVVAWLAWSGAPVVWSAALALLMALLAIGMMRLVAEAWNHLSDEQRGRWYVAGPSVPSRKVFGKAGSLDGRAFFSKVNLPQARLGQELLLEPPAQTDFGRNPAVAFTITNDKWDFALELTLAHAPAEEIMLWASPPCNPGKRRNWDYRVLGLLPTPVEGANNFRRLYVRRFGVPPAGMKVFLRVREQTNGWRGAPWEGSAVVPPRDAESGS